MSGVSGNTGFLGIPVCTALYGAEGAILALLYDLGASIYIATLGLSAYQAHSPTAKSTGGLLRTLRGQLVNPLFLSLGLGLGLALAGWQIPAILRPPLASLSNAVIPLMMLILGGLIYNSALQYSIDKRGVVLLGVLKLLIMPTLTWLAIGFLPIAGVPRGVAIIEAAMPSAIVSVTFASRYQADENLSASGTMLTTLLSVLTIPFFAVAVH
jgi:malate permease and related proteins